MASKFLPWINDTNVGTAELIGTSNWSSDSQRQLGFKANTPANAARVNSALRQTSSFVAAFMDIVDPTGTLEYTATPAQIATLLQSKVNFTLKNIVDNGDSNIKSAGLTTLSNETVLGTGLTDSAKLRGPLLGSYNAALSTVNTGANIYVSFAIGDGSSDLSRHTAFQVDSDGSMKVGSNSYENWRLTNLKNLGAPSAYTQLAYLGAGTWNATYTQGNQLGANPSGLYDIVITTVNGSNVSLLMFIHTGTSESFTSPWYGDTSTSDMYHLIIPPTGIVIERLVGSSTNLTPTMKWRKLL